MDKLPEIAKKSDQEIIEYLPEEQRLDYAGSITSLLNLIPFAGGTLASVISTNLNNIKLNKILSAIKLLMEKVENSKIKVEDILTEEQAVELLDRTLSELGRTSNSEKIKYFKNLLTSSYTRDDVDFCGKELYLNILTNLSVAEILLLKALYIEPDPFSSYEYPEPEDDLSRLGIKITPDIYAQSSIMPQYHVESIEYSDGDTSLIDYLKSHLHVDEEVINGAIAQLDAKGLSNMGNNYSEKTVRKVQYAKGQMPVVSPIGFADNITFTGREQKGTPMEKSQTLIGRAFMDFIASS